MEDSLYCGTHNKRAIDSKIHVTDQGDEKALGRKRDSEGLVH